MARARELGLEVALDLALQARPTTRGSPATREWFTTQADGTIAYAENPPKKYQDIYPLNFDNDPTGICREVLRVVRHWMTHGVRIFRVDNPHTKPVAFWEWLLREIRRTDPDVLFLAEAFTRPAMMHGLGAVGFHQSYTYFTWRTAQVGDRGVPPRGLARDRPPDAAELLRQHPRHPPRLPAVRRAGGVQGPRRARGHRLAELGRVRRLRAVRARRGQARAARSTSTRRSTRSGSATGTAPTPRAAPWRRTSPGSTQSAAHHPALQLLRNVTIHSQRRRQRAGLHASGTDDDVVHRGRSTSTRTAPARPWSTSTCPPSAWTGTTRFVVHDEITGEDWSWSQHNYVRLDPGHEPAHIITVRRTR